jgi:ferredoxin
MMLIEVDTGRCCASGMCALVAGDLFDQSEQDGTVVVLVPEVPPDRWAAARECEHNCPCQAITLRYPVGPGGR